MSFFDDPQNWSKTEVKTGRPWFPEELRIKSNADLHKLWYVLLRERNMLLTMTAEYKRMGEAMPSPQRLDKVEESMENLLDVVSERDRAFHLLEEGHSGEPGGAYRYNRLGVRFWRNFKEYPFPAHLNRPYTASTTPHGRWVLRYLRLAREKKMLLTQRARARKIRRMKMLEEHFPHLKMDDELLRINDELVKS